MTGETSGAYFVEDRSGDDLTRLQLLDQMLTRAMGGVLPEQGTPTAFRRVLDVGCGTGGWLHEMARTYPTIESLTGVDISNKMVQYARRQTTLHQLNERVTFHRMDALLLLEFPDRFFDLVNQRVGMSFLRTWEWWKILQEYKRVLRPEGIVQITEGEWGLESTSPALARLFDLIRSVFFLAGYSFTPERDGVICRLEQILSQHGFVHIQSRRISCEYHAGLEIWPHFFEMMKLTLQVIQPFLRKWTRLPDEYSLWYQQALKEMQQPDFVARGTLLTVWGSRL